MQDQAIYRYCDECVTKWTYKFEMFNIYILCVPIAKWIVQSTTYGSDSTTILWVIYSMMWIVHINNTYECNITLVWVPIQHMNVTMTLLVSSIFKCDNMNANIIVSLNLKKSWQHIYVNNTLPAVHVFNMCLSCTAIKTI